jgi:2-oxoacid:acceptor oxidoreductase gamma subunit (pyruvate/2-ketoisovalerate family)
MIEIVFHGRGGQGAVTASQIVATAAFREGKYAQAFPSFGPERRGAPVTAYARIDDQTIVDRSLIVMADYVIVLDPSALRVSNPLARVKDHGCAILNMDRSPKDIQREFANDRIEVFCVDASMISEQVYGKTSIPITNISMLGAFASVSGIIQLDTLLDAVDQVFSGEGADRAKKTARIAYEKMQGAKTE